MASDPLSDRAWARQREIVADVSRRVDRLLAERDALRVEVERLRRVEAAAQRCAEESHDEYPGGYDAPRVVDWQAWEALCDALNS